MNVLISQLIFILLGAVVAALVLAFFIKKRKNRTVVENDVVNDTSYNIAERESGEGQSVDDRTKLEGYLDDKKKGDSEPLNRQDFINYNKEVKGSSVDDSTRR